MKFLSILPTELKNPTIYLGDIRIDEPITTITDMIIAAMCIYFYAKLRSISNEGAFYKLTNSFFLLTGIATFLGGIMGHAFNYALGIEWKIPFWIISMLGIACFERSAILYIEPIVSNRLLKFLKWLNWVELAIFIFLAIFFINFMFVVGHTLYGMLFVVTAFHAYSYYKRKNQGSLLYLYAAGILFICLLCFLFKLGFGVWFNHLDVSHFFMAIAACFYYRGSILLYKEYTLPNANLIRASS